MNVRHAYAALRSHAAHCVAALLALTAAQLLTSCTDAGKCERGTEGCACFPETPRCEPGSGLSCVDGVCADNGSSGDGDGDGDGDMHDAGPPPVVDCDGDDVEALCGAFCEAFCQNQERFCFSSRCEAGDCDPGRQIVQTCVTRCSQAPGEDDQVACAMGLCEDQIADDLTCEEYGVDPSGGGAFETLCFDLDPMCVQNHERGCSDVCGSDNQVGGNYVDNGICEDGHNQESLATCARGTDCTDCGPQPCVDTGETCGSRSACCGYYQDKSDCVDPDGAGGDDAICSPVCGGDNPPCPDGFQCRATNAGNAVCWPLQ